MKRYVFVVLNLVFLWSFNVYGKEEIIFKKCVDGDTFRGIIKDEEKYIRLLAIDTPESVEEQVLEPFGKEASEYTCNLLTNAKKIEIEYDKNSDREDKYGRLLGYVYVDGVMLEKKLLEEGLAEVKYIYGDYKYTNDLKKIEEDAKIKKKGMWQDDILKDKDVEEFSFWDSLFDFFEKIIDKIIDKIFAND